MAHELISADPYDGPGLILSMNIWNSITRFFRATYDERFSPEGARSLATLYWRALLLLALTGVIVATYWGIINLQRALSELGTPLSNKIPPASIDRATLDRTVSAFGERKSTHESLKASSAGTITDPSR